MKLSDIFNNKKAPVDTDQVHTEVPYHMNVFSSDARKRSDIFTKVINKQGFTILPGRYGGEYNNDMLAAGEKEGQFMLLLGMKTTGSDGGIQLDSYSMGDFLQFSKNWLMMVVQSLRLGGKELTLADKIEQHTQTGDISLSVVYLDLNSKELNIIPVAMQ